MSEEEEVPVEELSSEEEEELPLSRLAPPPEAPPPAAFSKRGKERGHDAGQQSFDLSSEEVPVLLDLLDPITTGTEK